MELLPVLLHTVRFLSHRTLPVGIATLILASTPAYTQTPDWLDSAEINLHSSVQNNRSVNSDPQGNLLDTATSLGQINALLKLQKSFNDLRLVGQLRPRYTYQDKQQKTLLGVDELYLDYPLSQSIFISAGKRNIFTGVALGRNPVDYYGRNKNVDNTLSAEERRDQRKGDYLFSLDGYLSNANLSAHYAPKIHGIQHHPSRLLLSYNQLFANINTDASLFVYNGPRDGLGLTLSKTVSDNWVAYAESSLDKGRERNIANITQNQTHKHYLEAVVGSNFTFSSGLNHIVEYWHHGVGYTSEEWNSIITSIDLATQQLNTVNALGGIQQLVAINQGLTPELLRKNYVFSRLNYPIPSYRTELSLVNIANTDDQSHLMRLRLKKSLGKNTETSLQFQQTYGNNDSEFGMRTTSALATLNVKLIF